MSYTEKREALHKKFKEDFQKYVGEHPGETVVLEYHDSGIEATFYKTDGELEQALANYTGLSRRDRPEILTRQIPLKSHKFKEGNRHSDFTNDRVLVCPNEGETELVPVDGYIESNHGGGEVRYRTLVHCPDCGCDVFRRASGDEIRRDEENSRKQQTSSLVELVASH